VREDRTDRLPIRPAAAPVSTRTAGDGPTNARPPSDRVRARPESRRPEQPLVPGRHRPFSLGASSTPEPIAGRAPRRAVPGWVGSGSTPSSGPTRASARVPRGAGVRRWGPGASWPALRAPSTGRVRNVPDRWNARPRTVRGGPTRGLRGLGMGSAGLAVGKSRKVARSKIVRKFRVSKMQELLTIHRVSAISELPAIEKRNVMDWKELVAMGGMMIMLYIGISSTISSLVSDIQISTNAFQAEAAADRRALQASMDDFKQQILDLNARQSYVEGLVKKASSQ